MDLLVSEGKASSLSPAVLGSILYHDLFDYPLTLGEVIKWELGSEAGVPAKKVSVRINKGFYVLSGRQGLILKRLMRRRISQRKFRIAGKAARLLRIIPSVKMIGITGALAMENADEGSDIDFLIVTKKGSLWTTRLGVILLLKLAGLPIRRFGDKKQEDKLCLNMWLDETSLIWPKKERNLYTAHEIAQVKPLVNKNDTYERLVYLNGWVKDYWPNAVRVTEKPPSRQTRTNFLVSFIEALAFWAQFRYMKPKITKEIVGKKKALFHPTDWWEILRIKVDGILQT